MATAGQFPARDIAFTYMLARLIFGPSHPAIAFLLLLAIADDAAGLAVSPCSICWPLNPNGLFSQRRLWQCAGDCVKRRFRISGRIYSYPEYSVGPDLAGIHPALGLVPIIPCLPHAHTDLGIFAREELNRKDTLNELMH